MKGLVMSFQIDESIIKNLNQDPTEEIFNAYQIALLRNYEYSNGWRFTMYIGSNAQQLVSFIGALFYEYLSKKNKQTFENFIDEFIANNPQSLPPPPYSLIPILSKEMWKRIDPINNELILGLEEQK
jgi:hypothetical protein